MATGKWLFRVNALGHHASIHPSLLDNYKKKQSFFLHGLKSKNSRFKYGRYSGLPLRYAGGKSLAVGYVVEHLPHSIEELVSPFFGGGSVEIACAKELGLKVKGYDVFDILVNYWKHQIDLPKKLAKQLLKWKPTKQNYDLIKHRLKQHWNKEKPIQDKLSLAAHYWYNHNLSYGPGFLGWMSKVYECPLRYKRLVEKISHFKVDGLSVHRGSFEKIIPKHQGDFLYCDPPYYLGEDSKMFRGIYPQRNFPVHHNGFNHALLRDLLHSHSCGFILSYNDCKTIRDWYSDFTIHKVKWQYTLGQGETRIGKNRIERGSSTYVKNSHELLIVSQ